MSVIDRVKTHFETLKTITIEVEEWKDEHGNPSVFYSEPLTLEEKNIIFKKSNNFQDLNVLVDLLIMKLQVKNDKGEVLDKAYAAERFVRVLPPGELPSLGAVRGSNFCDVAAYVDERTNTLILLSALDNLVKGASGGAVQCANLLCGWSEELALLEAPLIP